jgi:predicted anti-sigma-YlaC factor YlaD
MIRADHQAAFEELTAYVDGELMPEDEAKVRVHLAECADCRIVEANVRSVSARLTTWTVGEPPAGLTAPRTARRPWRMRQWLPLAAGLLLAIGIVWLGQARSAPARVFGESVTEGSERETARAIAASAAATPQQTLQASPLLVRTASLSIIAADFNAARTEMERIVTAAGGFTGNITASGSRGSARSLSATLRIPEAQLDATIDALKRLGQVSRESRNAEDVTQQSTDLNARLANARISEKRLKDILENRTGDLSDVLSVEREIARVRGEIEGMEGERKALDGRITYARLALELAEEEKSAMDLGPMSVSTRLRNAFVEGWRSAFSTGLDATLVAVRVAPSLLLWGLVLALPAWYVRRHFAR